MPLSDVARQVAQPRVREQVLVPVLVQQQERVRVARVPEPEPVRRLARVRVVQELALLLERRPLHRRPQ